MEFQDSEWDVLYTRARQLALIRALELITQDSPEFDQLVEDLTEEYLSKL